MKNTSILKGVLELEAICLNQAAQKLTDASCLKLEKIYKNLLESKGSLVFCGVGKSGHIALKLASTFSSLGLPSFFLHPTEALHGDLGRVGINDAIVFISKSGTTEEILKLIPYLNVLSDMRIGLIGNQDSPIAREVGLNFDCSVEKEACLNNQAPTTSSTLALAMGDSLAVFFEHYVSLTKEDFAFNHPGGILGKSLRIKVKDLMSPKEKCPIVSSGEILQEILLKMTSLNVGGCAVLNQKNELEGIIVEGDIRRAFVNKKGVNSKASEVMTKGPITINDNQLASEALTLMESRKSSISILPVINDKKEFIGFISLHDLLKEGFSL